MKNFIFKYFSEDKLTFEQIKNLTKKQVEDLMKFDEEIRKKNLTVKDVLESSWKCTLIEWNPWRDKSPYF